MSYHTIIVVGKLGGDPEMRYSPGGDAVTSFSVASDRQYTAKDGAKIKETLWFRVSVWGKQAESCNQYLKKGKSVLVEGRLIGDASGNPRIWNRKDNTPGASFEINAEVVRFLDGSSSTTTTTAEEIPF